MPARCCPAAEKNLPSSSPYAKNVPPDQIGMDEPSAHPWRQISIDFWAVCELFQVEPRFQEGR